MAAERRTSSTAQLWMYDKATPSGALTEADWVLLTSTAPDALNSAAADRIAWGANRQVRRLPAQSVQQVTTVVEGQTSVSVDCTDASSTRFSDDITLVFTDGASGTHNLHDHALNIDVDYQVQVQAQTPVSASAVNKFADYKGMLINMSILAGDDMDDIRDLTYANRKGSATLTETNQSLTATFDCEVIPEPLTLQAGGLQLINMRLIATGPVTYAGSGSGTDGLFWQLAGSTRRLRFRPRGTGSALPEYQVEAVVVPRLSCPGGRIRRWALSLPWDGDQVTSTQPSG